MKPAGQRALVSVARITRNSQQAYPRCDKNVCDAVCGQTLSAVANNVVAARQTAVAPETLVERLEITNVSRHNAEPVAMGIRLASAQKSLPPAPSNFLAKVCRTFVLLGFSRRLLPIKSFLEGRPT